MKDEQEFYRCLVSDAAGRALLRIRDILSVPSRFMRKIVCRLRLNEVNRQ